MNRFLVIQYRPYSDAIPFILGEYNDMQEAIEESKKYTESRGGWKWLGRVYYVRDDYQMYPVWTDPKLNNT